MKVVNGTGYGFEMRACRRVLNMEGEQWRKISSYSCSLCFPDVENQQKPAKAGEKIDRKESCLWVEKREQCESKLEMGALR